MQKKGFHDQATGLTFQLASCSFAAAEKGLSWLHHCCKPEGKPEELKIGNDPLQSIAMAVVRHDQVHD